MMQRRCETHGTVHSQLTAPVQPEGRCQVRDIMSASPVTVSPGISVYEAQQCMQHCHIRHLPVLENGRLVGMVSDRDIRLVLPSPATSLSRWELHYLLDKLTIGEVMARTVVTVIPDCPVSEAVSHLLHHKIGALPVLEERHMVGIVTRTDILRAFLSNACGCHVGHD